ncbi:hypothetical protein CXF70_10330 [Planomicrobium sp. MB-3u-38]|nr:hypothetical protein CXF70_10330 [Planomicrobium sp. MB-3u-38]
MGRPFIPTRLTLHTPIKQNRTFLSTFLKVTYVNNVAAENFYGLLKQEMYDGEAMVSYDELKQKIERYIYNFNHEGIK